MPCPNAYTRCRGQRPQPQRSQPCRWSCTTALATYLLYISVRLQSRCAVVSLKRPTVGVLTRPTPAMSGHRSRHAQVENLPEPLRDAISLGAVAGGASYTFDTARGGRLLPLRYVHRLLLAVRHELQTHPEGGVRAQFWLVSEAWPSWFAPLVEAVPGLRLLTAPPGASHDGDEPSAALRHLDVLANADVLLLGGGAR